MSAFTDEEIDALLNQHCITCCIKHIGIGELSNCVMHFKTKIQTLERERDKLKAQVKWYRPLLDHAMKACKAAMTYAPENEPIMWLAKLKVEIQEALDNEPWQPTQDDKQEEHGTN